MWYEEPAISRRTCHQCREGIAPGEFHIATYEARHLARHDITVTARRNLCLLCAEKIVKSLKKRNHEHKTYLRTSKDCERLPPF